MKIAVFCSSRLGNNPAFAEAAGALGQLMAQRGHTLIYGGEENGLMTVVSHAVLDAGGPVTGIIPRNIPFMLEGINPRLTETVFTEDMASRKTAMMQLAEGFIALPGSVGTLDEVTEILSLIKVGEMDKPVVLLNTAGFYEDLRRFFAHMREAGIAGAHDFDRLLVTESPEEALAFLEKAQ
ncbi:MAG: TIGR00730 family Rossman fold protein [Lachnospiraceae bacterium]|nr:TIGR00730 family Rossman fold protein [Lachnospiraceae bacterium]